MLGTLSEVLIADVREWFWATAVEIARRISAIIYGFMTSGSQSRDIALDRLCGLDRQLRIRRPYLVDDCPIAEMSDGRSIINSETYGKAFRRDGR